MIRKITPEGRVKGAVIRILKFYGWFTQINVQGFGMHNGRPDLEALKNGITIWIECKSPAGRLSDTQKEYIRVLETHGGIVMVANDPERFLVELEQLHERLWPGTGLKRLF